METRSPSERSSRLAFYKNHIDTTQSFGQEITKKLRDLGLNAQQIRTQPTAANLNLSHWSATPRTLPAEAQKFDHLFIVTQAMFSSHNSFLLVPVSRTGLAGVISGQAYDVRNKQRIAKTQILDQSEIKVSGKLDDKAAITRGFDQIMASNKKYFLEEYLYND